MVFRAGFDSVFGADIAPLRGFNEVVHHFRAGLGAVVDGIHPVLLAIRFRSAVEEHPVEYLHEIFRLQVALHKLRAIQQEETDAIRTILITALDLLDPVGLAVFICFTVQGQSV